jgi:hypothetical protein
MLEFKHLFLRLENYQKAINTPHSDLPRSIELPYLDSFRSSKKMVVNLQVAPLLSDIDLCGKIALVNGTSAGIGLETARQLLQFKYSTVVLAVRNIFREEACTEQLLDDPAINEESYLSSKCPSIWEHSMPTGSRPTRLQE